MVSILEQFNTWVAQFRDNLKPYLEEKQVIAEEEKNLKEEIEEAHQQWVEAQQYFDSVSDPELIDHASYMIQAAQTKYIYLLNKAKEEENEEVHIYRG